MLTTLTPDPVLDKAYLISSWVPGSTMQANRTNTSVGGKGLDASVALSHLGIDSRAYCFLGGKTGEDLLALLQTYGILTIPTWVTGETRTATIIVEQDQQRHSHIFSGGLQIEPDQATDLVAGLQANLADISWLICGGILPPTLRKDFFAEITKLAHQQGKPVLIDSFGDYLLPALAAQPEIVKMNWREFERTFGLEIPDLQTLLRQARKIQADYRLPALVITCGKDGLLGLSAAGYWLAQPPRQKVVNAAGAGDAASGVLAWRLAEGEGWPEALSWAAAAGAAVALTETTADLRRSDFEKILPEVRIEPIGAA